MMFEFHLLMDVFDVRGLELVEVQEEFVVEGLQFRVKVLFVLFEVFVVFVVYLWFEVLELYLHLHLCLVFQYSLVHH